MAIKSQVTTSNLKIQVDSINCFQVQFSLEFLNILKREFTTLVPTQRLSCNIFSSYCNTTHYIKPNLPEFCQILEISCRITIFWQDLLKKIFVFFCAKFNKILQNIHLFFRKTYKSLIKILFANFYRRKYVRASTEQLQTKIRFTV